MLWLNSSTGDDMFPILIPQPPRVWLGGVAASQYLLSVLHSFYWGAKSGFGEPFGGDFDETQKLFEMFTIQDTFLKSQEFRGLCAFDFMSDYVLYSYKL